MSDNMCQWKPGYAPDYECPEDPLPNDPNVYCILHSRDENKDIQEFAKKVEERMTKGRLTSAGWEIDKIDLTGCCFRKGFPAEYFKDHTFDKPVDFSVATFSQAANFFEATFSQVNFSEVTFSQEADFNRATFSQKVDFSYATFLKADFSEAKFSQKAHFSGATFSQEADFSGATFSQAVDFFDATFSQADFSGATFSQGAVFYEAKFSERANFSGATFPEIANFSRAEFKGPAVFRKTSFGKDAMFEGTIFNNIANFDSTAFKGDTNFAWAEFWEWTFFFKNSKLTYARPERPLELDEIRWPRSVENKIGYDENFDLLSFEGTMSQGDKKELLRLSEDDSYKKAIGELYDLSQIITFGKESVFQYARFEGKTIRFQDVDLSQCSFLHSNIDKVDFRNCDFTKVKGRQNVLKDELDCDQNVGRTVASPVPTEKKTREGYEPVHRLYLELKRNFEDKKDWNMAGDFHYGEMECRRKMKGWWKRNILSLEALYYWASGYGERPWRAFIVLSLLILIVFPIVLSLNEWYHQSFCLWNWGWVFLDSSGDSLEVATFMRLTRIGEPIKPDNTWDTCILVSESIVVYIQIALLALALRRKMKR